MAEDKLTFIQPTSETDLSKGQSSLLTPTSQEEATRLDEIRKKSSSSGRGSKSKSSSSTSAPSVPTQETSESSTKKDYVEGTIKTSTPNKTSQRIQREQLIAPQRETIEVTKSSGKKIYIPREEIRETKSFSETVDLFKLGFTNKKPILDVQPTTISKSAKSLDAGAKFLISLKEDVKISKEELKLIPLSTIYATIKFGKGAIQSLNPLGLADSVGGVVESGARVVTKSSTIGKEIKTSKDQLSTSLYENPLEVSGAIFAGAAIPSIIKGSKAAYVKKIAPKIDKINPNKPYYVEKIGVGVEKHKGSFTEFQAVYKGESFVRKGEVVGVRRVVKPSLQVLKKNPIEFAISVKEKLQGKKPGQIARFDPIGENIAFRDTPSEFATPTTELSLATTKQRVSSVTPDSSFIPKEGKFTVISGGGKQIETLSGRAGVGGGELSQFFAPPIQNNNPLFKKGTTAANVFYSELKPLDYAAKKVVITKPNAGVILKTVTPEKPSISSLKKSYVDLSQDLAAYTKPGTTQLSGSTLKGIRTESELLTSPGTITKTRQFTSVTIPGRGNIKLFSGRDIPLSKSQTINALDSNVEFLKGRIEAVKGLVKDNPSLNVKGQSIILREEKNILLIEKAKQDLLKSSTSKSTKALSNDKIVKVSSESLSPSNSLVTSKSTKALSNDKIVKVSSESLSPSKIKYETVTEYLSKKTSPLSKVTTTSTSTLVNNNAASTIITTSKKRTPSQKISSISKLSSTIPELTATTRISGVTNYKERLKKSIVTPAVTKKKSSSGKISSTYKYEEKNIYEEQAPPVKSSSPKQYRQETQSPFNIFNSRKSDEGSKEFTVQVRQRGEFISIFKTKSKEIAFRTGLSEARGRSSASVRVKQDGRIITPTRSFKGFTTSKKEKGVLIEESKYRINSPGELSEITLKGIRTDKDKKKKKKKKFNNFF